MAELLTIVVLVLGAWLIIVMVKNRMPESSNAGEEVRTRVRVNENGIIIKERHSSLHDALEVVASREVNTSYVPDRYVYTSATVGGITTGGVTKLEGGNVVSLGAKTGDYYLTYKYGKYNESGNMRWSSRYVSAVSLPKADFNLAKSNSVLKKYIPDEKGRENLTTGWRPCFTEDEATTSLVLISMTKSDAEYVRDWLSTSNKMKEATATPTNQDNQTLNNAHISQTQSVSSAKAIERNSFSGSDDAFSTMEFHHSDEWYGIKNQLVADSSTKTNNLSEDVEYCISRLGVILCSDLLDILGEQLFKIRPCLTPLIDEGLVERVEHKGEVYFFWKKKKNNNISFDTSQILQYYGSDEWRTEKENLTKAGYSTYSNNVKKCTSDLKVFKLGDLMEVFKCSHGAARGALTPLITDKFIERIEENGRPIYVVNEATFESTPTAASTVPAAKASPAKSLLGNDAPPVLTHYNVNKFEEVKKYKELLDSGIITQEEFDTKKKQLLGL